MTTARTKIKHDGKEFAPGDKLTKSDFGDAWDQLLADGAIDTGAPAKGEPDEGETGQEFDAKRATIPELRARLEDLDVGFDPKATKDELAALLAKAESGTGN